MTPLAAAVLLLGVVDKALEMRLKQYVVNPALLKLDADNAEDLALLGAAILAAAVKIGAAIEAGTSDLLDG